MLQPPSHPKLQPYPPGVPAFLLTCPQSPQGVKETELTLPLPDGPRPLRLAVASGIKNARVLLQRMREGRAPQYDFVEVGGTAGRISLVRRTACTPCALRARCLLPAAHLSSAAKECAHRLHLPAQH